MTVELMELYIQYAYEAELLYEGLIRKEPSELSKEEIQSYKEKLSRLDFEENPQWGKGMIQRVQRIAEDEKREWQNTVAYLKEICDLYLIVDYLPKCLRTHKAIRELYRMHFMEGQEDIQESILQMMNNSEAEQDTTLWTESDEELNGMVNSLVDEWYQCRNHKWKTWVEYEKNRWHWKHMAKEAHREKHHEDEEAYYNMYILIRVRKKMWEYCAENFRRFFLNAQ